jgi:transposase
VELFRRSTQRDRLIFVWHHLGGASQTEIAEHLQVTRRTVYTRLRAVEQTARVIFSE